jgi:hypothetical protein
MLGSFSDVHGIVFFRSDANEMCLGTPDGNPAALAAAGNRSKRQEYHE